MSPRKPSLAKKPSAISSRKAAESLNSAASPLIFVSHDSRDAGLAEAFSKLLGSVSAGMLKSFRSSDKRGTEGIEFGTEWYPEVMSKIDSASDVVCLLTPRSLERPWILYEAGVAKGKMNTPVYGVAIGISLSKAASGPFAQFQNCGDDADSLTKLVMQLMCRVSGAEPDKDTVKLQVEGFKQKADVLTKDLEVVGKTDKIEVEGSSVAKLFEEVKVMFRDLPSRMDERSERTSRLRSRHFRPEIMFEVGHMLDSGREDGLRLLILASMFRDDLPWLYELGMEAYRELNSGRPERARSAVKKFTRATELVSEHPAFRELVRGRDMYIIVREMHEYLLDFQNACAQRPVTRLDQRRRRQRLRSQLRPELISLA
jgi:hypothetical protein